MSHESVYISHLSFECKDSDDIFITQIFDYILTIFCKSRNLAVSNVFLTFATVKVAIDMRLRYSTCIR